MQWGHYTIKSASQYLCTNPRKTFHLHEYVWDGEKATYLYMYSHTIAMDIIYIFPQVLKDPRIGIS